MTLRSDAHLAWSDFDHLGPARDLAARLLAGGKEGRARGINLLVHGPVGTGKTEFCKSLAARYGLAIWSVGETDEEGGEPNRMERLAALRLAQRLLKQRAGALILFDEAEDLLGHAEGFFGSRSRGGQAPKIHVNQFIEQNQVPVLWTCNDVDLIDPAVLRRMTLAVEIGTPTQPVRARIWRRVLADLGRVSTTMPCGGSPAVTRRRPRSLPMPQERPRLPAAVSATSSRPWAACSIRNCRPALSPPRR